MHRWYSRKPLSFSRASVLAPILPAEISLEEFKYLLGLEPGKEIKLYKTPASSVRIKRDPNTAQAWWDDLRPEVANLVEQRIGRLDRIGQIYDTVRINNFYYDGTVEAKVYKKLRDRVDAFQTVVGNLQPILATVPTFIEQAVMSADPKEEGVLLGEFDRILDAPPPGPALDEMVAMDVESDFQEIRQLLQPTSLFPETIENLFVNSLILKQIGAIFDRSENRTWHLNYKSRDYAVTFYPDIFDENASLQLMSFGNPLFEEMLKDLAPRPNCP